MKIKNKGSETLVRHKFDVKYSDESFTVYVYVISDGTFVNFEMLNKRGVDIFEDYPDDYCVEVYNAIIKDSDIVNQLMNLGDLSSLNEKLYPDDSKPHTFQNQQEDVCVAYGRERNESDVDCKIFKDISDFEKFGSGVDYQYLFEDGVWMYRNCNQDTEWKRLTAEDCEE